MILDTELYYAGPCQVKYWDSLNQNFRYGIAVYDYIIDAIDGTIIPIPQLIMEAYKENQLDSDHSIIELEWLSLESSIRG